MYIFKFSDIGEGIHEGTIGEIFVKENQLIKEGQNLFLVETDKMTTYITSPIDGTIRKILIKNNDVVRVGQELFYIEEKNSSSPNNNQNLEQNISNLKKDEVQKKDNNNIESASSVIGEVKVSNNLINSFGDQNKQTLNEQKEFSNNILISPIARMMAIENNVDLNKIIPSGPNKRILREDIENYLKNNKPVNNVLLNELNNKNLMEKKEDKIFNISQIRKTIASNLKKSTDNVSYTNLTFKIDVTNLWNERNKIKDDFFKKYNFKLSIFPFIVKAISLSLVDFPLFNSIYDELNKQIILKAQINVGIAISTNNGLIVPNIKNANNLSIFEIAKTIDDLVIKTKNNSLLPNDFKDGSFSITNYGSLGALEGVPIIKYPELAIAGIGAVYDELKKDNNDLITKYFFNLTIAADHKWIDGGDIANFSLKIKKYLENILLFLF